MTVRKSAQAICALVLLAACLLAQTVSSSITGTVLDPANSVVPNVAVTLTDENTGSVRTGVTDNTGIFRFLNVPPGSYSVSIQAPGFKNLVQSNVMVSANDTRDVGKLALAIGNTSEKISVVAEATAIQLASSEKSQLVDGKQLNDITLKGRDVFGYLKLVPGVIDTNWNRNVTDPGSINNIVINGNNALYKNFTVDGITDMDTGSNSTIHYEPNIDAIQELKVLTSNYQAEFGRNSGGTITIVTKSGTQQFHGTGAWNHRHEAWNANSWTNNRNGLNALGQEVSPRSKYRLNVETYSIGGPVFIPKVFNTEKKTLLSFWSQEYTGQYVPASAQSKYTPTLLERGGDFSQTRQNNGSLYIINDPATGAPFPGNIIPKDRNDPIGLAMQNYYTTPI